jgi:23S rRNA (uracil1939-C5)-methyltransferase
MSTEINPILTLTIEKLVYGGCGLTHHEGKAIFIKNVAPGDLVEARIKYKKKGVRWAELIRIVEPNAQYHIKAKCQHALECGGCSYQHLSHSSQIKIKEEILKEIYKNEIELEASIVSPVEHNYRNKCEFTFGNNLVGELELGLHPEGKFFEVLDLQECYLLPKPVWDILVEAKKLAQASGLNAYRDLKDEGFWATLTIRYSSSSGDCLLVWKVKDPSEPKLKEISQQLQNKFSYIKGSLARPTPRGSLQLIAGRDTLAQAIGNVDFVYGADNFFQINTAVLPLFMEQVTKLVKSTNPDIVYDLFGGVGAIGIYIAKNIPNLQKVIGAEADELACTMAEFNAELNSVANYESNFLNLFKSGWGKFLKTKGANATVIVDPPRAGLTSKTIKEIIEINPQNIIYVSCNPSTQKRDIEEFQTAGFKLKSLQLVDMFPQTMHLEAIAVLSVE